MCDSIIHVITFSNNPLLSRIIDWLLWFVSIEAVLVIVLTAAGVYLGMKGFKKDGWKIAVYLVPALLLLMVAMFGFLQDSIFTDKCEYRSYFSGDEFVELSANMSSSISGVPLRAEQRISKGSFAVAEEIVCLDCPGKVERSDSGWKFSERVVVSEITRCVNSTKIIILEGEGSPEDGCKTDI